MKRYTYKFTYHYENDTQIEVIGSHDYWTQGGARRMAERVARLLRRNARGTRIDVDVVEVDKEGSIVS